MNPDHKFTIRFILIVLLIIAATIGSAFLLVNSLPEVPAPSYTPTYPPSGTYPILDYDLDEGRITFLADPEGDGTYHLYYTYYSTTTIIPDAETGPYVTVEYDGSVPSIVILHVTSPAR